jgi:hypothetical protein
MDMPSPSESGTSQLDVSLSLVLESFAGRFGAALDFNASRLGDSFETIEVLALLQETIEVSRFQNAARSIVRADLEVMYARMEILHAEILATPAIVLLRERICAKPPTFRRIALQAEIVPERGCWAPISTSWVQIGGITF